MYSAGCCKGTLFSCFTGAKVQILTPEERGVVKRKICLAPCGSQFGTNCDARGGGGGGGGGLESKERNASKARQAANSVDEGAGIELSRTSQVVWCWWCGRLCGAGCVVLVVWELVVCVCVHVYVCVSVV